MHSYRFEFHGVTPCLQKETYHIYLHFITHYTMAYAMNSYLLLFSSQSFSQGSSCTQLVEMVSSAG